MVSQSWVRPHSDLHVAVTVQGTSADTVVDLELFNGNPDLGNRSYTQQVTVPPDSTRTAKLQVSPGSGTGEPRL